jgi:hypothetical protein
VSGGVVTVSAKTTGEVRHDERGIDIPGVEKRGVTEFVAMQHRWRRVVAVGSCQRPQMAAISVQQDGHPADIGSRLFAVSCRRRAVKTSSTQILIAAAFVGALAFTNAQAQ